MRLPTGEYQHLENRALRYTGEQLYHPEAATGDADKLFISNKIRPQPFETRTVDDEEFLRSFQKTVMLEGIKRCATV